MTVNLMVHETGAAAARLDPESAEWLGALAGGGPQREAATELTPRQREVIVALAVNGVPLDALVAKLGSTRGAIYKMEFDARRKLRAALAANGYLDQDTSGRS